MEEAAELATYLPLSFKTPKEQEYIEICLGFDVKPLADRPGFQEMRELHAALVEKYKVEDANSAA